MRPKNDVGGAFYTDGENFVQDAVITWTMHTTLNNIKSIKYETKSIYIKR